MELTIPTVISMTSIIFCIATFVVNRKDKAVQNAKENNMALINFRLDELDKNVQKILDKLDNYDSEIDNRIEKALQIHIKMYHKENN